MDYRTSHLTQVFINLNHLTHNMRLLQSLVGNRPLWPAIKANAYGHGANLVARHLVGLGYTRLCVADAAEAIELIETGIEATFIVLSPALPETSEYFVAYDLQPTVCTLPMVEGLARAAKRAGRRVTAHLKVDTGMGRVGIRPDEVAGFLQHCRNFPDVVIKGLMSHFPCADETDKTFSQQQIQTFIQIKNLLDGHPVEASHMANSAAIFDLPESHFDAARPGIAIYGLKPSQTMHNPRVDELRPMLEWKTRITFLKEVPAGTGLSYGRTYFTDKPALIATVPVGYGDGLSRLFSNRRELLVHGIRCPQVGRITMDQSLVDVTNLRGRVMLGDEAVIVGRQGDDEITADELAAQLGTINYEIVTAISRRVPRIAVNDPI